MEMVLGQLGIHWQNNRGTPISLYIQVNSGCFKDLNGRANTLDFLGRKHRHKAS